VGAPRTRAAEPARRRRPDRLEPGLGRLDQRPGKKGGQATGPNPTDRGKKGTKRHLVVDAQGVPLATLLTGANVNDSRVLAEVLDAIPPIHRPRGRPRRRPAKLHADKGYDVPRCHALLRARRIVDRIARKQIDSSQRLGRHRWVVERTGAWFNRYRRLRVRDERRADIHAAFVALASALILFARLQQRY
jgi:transposase